jgi:putative restriction endonuclease
MSIAEISDQQLDTHPELGWGRGETDMAKQRANWLRSMGLVERDNDEYALTAEGRQFVEDAVEEWANTAWTPDSAEHELTAGTYETTAHARAVDPEFRATVLSRHERACPVSGVDHPGLLDVAHVLSWNDYPEYRADLANVLPLSKTHHAAFDRGIFTIDQDYRLRVNPSFDTQSDVLQQTIINRAGQRVQLPDGSLDPDYVSQRNAALEWV